MAQVPHEASQRPGTPPAAVEPQRPSAARSHSTVVGPDADYERHTQDLKDDANSDELAGRGKGGQRFGGMGHAGYRDGQPRDEVETQPGGMTAQAGAQQPATHTSTAGTGTRIVRSPSPASSLSGSSSDSDTSDDALSSDEESRAAAAAVATQQQQRKNRTSSGLIDTEAEMGIGGAGYGKMAVSLDEGEQRRREKERRDDDAENQSKGSKFWPGGSKSYSGGGMGPGYMRCVAQTVTSPHAVGADRVRVRRMIHALAEEDKEAERKARHERRKHRHHLRKHRHGGDHKKDGEAEGEKSPSDEDHAKFASPPEHAATTPTLARTEECELKESDPARDFAAAEQRKKARKQEKKDRRAERERDGETDMASSSLLAIHRPIEQRRRTMSDVREADEERERAPVDQAKVDEIEREQGEYEKKYPGMGSRQATSTSVASVDTVERREKLSEKLMDVFGLDEAEEVVAGACSVLLVHPPHSPH